MIMATVVKAMALIDVDCGSREFRTTEEVRAVIRFRMTRHWNRDACIKYSYLKRLQLLSTRLPITLETYIFDKPNTAQPSHRKSFREKITQCRRPTIIINKLIEKTTLL